MLKLLKHDIKDSYLEIVFLNGLMIVLAFLAFVIVKIAPGSGFILGIVFTAWGFTLFADCFVVFNSIIKSFHKKLFTDQGYLTLTTPVSIDKLLLSKIIVNMMWIIATVISVFICVMIIISSVVDIAFFSDIFNLIVKNPLDVFKMVITGLVSALNLITTLIFVLVLVNIGIMKKHKLLKGVFLYLVISNIVSLSNPFQDNLIRLLAGSDPIISQTGDYIVSLVINLIWSVGFYFASRHFITNNLELE